MAEMKNRAAFHEYFMDATYEAGMVLTGTEVKSLRQGLISFNDSYCLIDKEECWLKSLHIGVYSHGNLNNHEPLRDRKLLLKKREISKIDGKLKEKGYTLIPLKIYFNEKGFVKIELGLARGKKLHDKRDTLKKKEMEREMKRHLK